MNGFFIIRIFSNISNLILCWVGFRAFKYQAPVYARVFLLLNIFEQLAEMFIWISANQPGRQALANNASVVAEIVVYSYIFYKITYSKIIKWFFIFFNTLIVFRCLFLLIKNGFDQYINSALQLSYYLILLISTFTYFREIFIFRKQEDLLKDFTFWLVAGCMFYFAASIIYYIGLGYLYMIKADHHLDDFYLFSGIVFIIGNSICIKAYLCLKNG